MGKEKIIEDVRDMINKKMEEEGRILTWLAEKTEINYNTLHSCIKRKLFLLSEENLTKINEALGTDFE